MEFFGRASKANRESAEQERRRFALAQAKALAALTARGYSLDAAAAALAEHAPSTLPAPALAAAPDFSKFIPKAAATVQDKAPELAGPDLKIYPGLAAAAEANDETLALWLWNFARALDARGEGRIERAELAEHALKIISRDKLKRALRQAQAVGLVHLVRRRSDGAEVVAYVCAEDAARALGVAHVGAYPVLVPAGKGRTAATWKAALWAAYHAGRTDKAGVISRAELERKTGVPERTQRRHERRAGVKARGNFELVPVGSKAEAERLKAWHAECGRTAFIGRGRFKSYLIVRHPNSYTVPGARLAKRGRVRSLNSALSGGLLISARGQHEKEPRCRTHYDTREGAVKAVKRISEVLEEPPRVVYLNGWTKSGAANLWRRVVVL